METETPVCSDETAVRALEMHRVEGDVIRTLAPLDRDARLRVMAAVICMNDGELAALVVREFQARVR